MIFNLEENSERIKLVKWIDEQEDKTVDITLVKDQRTLTQNRAIHKYFELLAYELNEAGFDVRKVIDEAVEIPFTASFIKEYMWKPVQKSMLNKISTAKLNTDEVNEIYLVVDKIVSERTGITIPFPSIESQSYER